VVVVVKGAVVGGAVVDVGADGAALMYAATASMCAVALVIDALASGSTVKLATTPLPDAANVTPVMCAEATPRTVASAFWYTILIAAVTVEIFWFETIIVACTEALGCMIAVAEADVMCGMIIGTTPTLVALVDTASGTLEINEVPSGGGLM
jgi:hypothetical protein